MPTETAQPAGGGASLPEPQGHPPPIYGNPSAFATGGPKPAPPSPRARMVYWAQWGVLHQQLFEYHESAPQRSEMFHLALGQVGAGGKIRADCSQWYSAIAAKAGGVQGLTDQDYTGTLLQKGRLVQKPKPGDCAIFGGGTGRHAAMVTYNGYTIGFGHSPGAPDRVKLSDMIAWFAQHGYPGVRYLAFLP